MHKNKVNPTMIRRTITCMCDTEANNDLMPVIVNVDPPISPISHRHSLNKVKNFF